jgi:hypothetical protein
MPIPWKIPILLGVALLCGELAWLALSPVHPAPAAPVANLGSASIIGRDDSSALSPQPDPLRGSSTRADVDLSSAFLPPYASLAAALQIPDRIERGAALSKLLAQWAAHDPGAALGWARSQAADLRQAAILAVLRDMPPEAAQRLGAIIIGQEPDHAGDYALAVVQGLSNQKQFAAAIRFANSIPSDARPDWMAAIFRTWGTSDPQAALQTLAGIDPASHDDIFRALVDGWSTGDPAQLAAYALSMPPGQDRTYALATAADRWSLQDPAAMSAWLAQAPPSPEFDPAIADLLTRSDSVNRPPALAMSWAASITDPSLRFSTAEHIAREWKQSDPTALRAYANSAAWLTPDQRAGLLQIIDAPVPALDGSGAD